MSFANYTFRFSDEVELRFKGLCIATVEADPYGQVKERLDRGETDLGFGVVEDGESFYLYATEYGNLMLVHTYETASARGGSIHLVDRAASYERFENDDDLIEYLKERAQIEDRDCPYTKLLDEWGRHSVVEQLTRKKRRFGEGTPA